MPGNRLKQLAADQKMVAGVTQHLMGLATIMVGGVAMKPADIVTKVTTRITAGSTVETTEATHAAAVAANKVVLSQTHQFMLDLEQAIEVQVGPAVDTLADFGLAPKKAPTPPSPATKVAAAAKRKATRVARGTTGPKKKLSVKGNVTGVEITPVTAPDAAASGPQPSPQPAANGTPAAPASGGNPPAHS